MKPSQYKQVTGDKAGNISVAEKEAIKTARFGKLFDALAITTGGAPVAGKTINATEVENILKQYDSEVIASLDDEILKQAEVIKHLDPGDLSKLAEKGLKKSVKEAIVAEINDASTRPGGYTHKSIDYITTGLGKDVWKV